ncbi:hypothetical protein BC941DRAFT_471747 [Chlamydoabsidia padenii]|nr:hypothetical protein BC941DRAFT_471747 [Chlamydoabsidia padenii]
MFPPCRLFPATCELCGNWLPEHQTSCPRNGVHPSQWTLDGMTRLDGDEDENENIDIMDQPESLEWI